MVDEQGYCEAYRLSEAIDAGRKWAWSNAEVALQSKTFLNP